MDRCPRAPATLVEQVTACTCLAVLPYSGHAEQGQLRQDKDTGCHADFWLQQVKEHGHRCLPADLCTDSLQQEEDGTLLESVIFLVGTARFGRGCLRTA